MSTQVAAVAASNGSNSDSIKIIQEMFQDYNDFGYKQALAELDQAIARHYTLIVIEPARLSMVTRRWIRLGIHLRRLCISTGITACGLMLIAPGKYSCVAVPLAALSLSACIVHHIEWEPDPCFQYEIVDEKSQIADLETSNSNSALVLRRRTDSKAVRIAQYSVVAVTCALFFYGLLTDADAGCCSYD
jgi:hypothetical protein